jgi:ribosomal protein L32
MPEQTAPPEECANCGAAIPRHARACPECGADERTGWRESSVYDGLDLPGNEDDADPRPSRTPPKINAIAWYWWLAGALLLVLFSAWALGLR